MDIDLLRTFLEVRRLGNFHSAAENLHVTQAAVSQRVKHLESILNAPLFVREKNNIYPTPAGEQLVSTAESILSAWNQARHDIGSLPSNNTQLSLAAQPGAWDLCGKTLLGVLKQERPTVSFQVDQLSDDAIAKRIVRQTLDLGFGFTQHSNEIINCVAVRDFEIALYSSTEMSMSQVVAQPNVYVDWGREARALYDELKFQQPPGLQTRDHCIARDYLDTHGGVAFLPINPNRRASKLKLVSKSPKLRRTVYALWHSAAQEQVLFATIVESLAKLPIQKSAKV